MREVGLACAPADAHPWTGAHAHWRSARRGGRGAARDLCDLILIAQNLIARNPSVTDDLRGDRA
ncbi:MAG: hypothetical protein E6Q88_14625 [Lysobacteraceae bacterium]|nr:MAG: hypothetical protein E6Q88_14625 [Xanthomonadaceae bacterium]